MATIKLNEVRESYKGARIYKSFGQIIDTMIRALKANEDECNELNLSTEQTALAKRVLPKSKKDAKQYSEEIYKYLKIGEPRMRNGEIWMRADGAPVLHTWTEDGVLRFFTMKYNEAIPEAKVEKKHIKHECATHKTKECKDENKKTANTMK
jgi:hypothetical protein